MREGGIRRAPTQQFEDSRTCKANTRHDAVGDNAESKEFDEAVLRKWMDAALSRPEDRELFGLDLK